MSGVPRGLFSWYNDHWRDIFYMVGLKIMVSSGGMLVAGRGEEGGAG